ncbi:MAG: TatD family hydrolase [Candidatus Dormibacteria bacterium]
MPNGGGGTGRGASALPGLVDTHCHLVLLEERGLLHRALEEAAAAGVEQIVSVGLNLDDSERNRRLAEAHPGVFFTVGWHPHEPAPPTGAQLRALDELLAHPRAVAVGEIGLDQFWRPGYHEVPLGVQQRSLAAMLELAAGRTKPVVIHDRDSHEDVLGALGDRTRLGGGVMHCYSGDLAFAERCVAAGLLTSYAGTVTFPRSEGIQAAAAGIGDDAVLLETDAPFLAPVPFRGRPNLPGYVTATATRVAELRGVPAGALAERCGANARRLFNLPDPASGDRVGD